MFQQSCYAECFVPRKNRIQDTIIKFMLIAADIISVFSLIYYFMLKSPLLMFVSLVAGGIFIALSCYLFPRFKVDWEYIFVDGQLDFDQILGGNARKQKDRIDFEKVEAVAPTGSYHLDNFKNVNMTLLDYSSLTGADTFSIICHKGEKIVEILFEPNAEMIKMMKQKSPRKVFED